MWQEFTKENVAQENLWWQTCKKRDEPHIVIRKTGRRWRLEWNYDTNNSDHWERMLYLDRKGLYRVLYVAFCQLALSKRAVFDGSGLEGSIPGLILDDARLSPEVFIRS
jgi:hypothetical protein